MVLPHPACSAELSRYFDALQRGAAEAYRVAGEARRTGWDPETVVEIPQTEDLAARAETLLRDYGVDGLAKRTRELSKDHDRETVAILAAKEFARRPSRSKEEAVERAVRVGLAILTEGILVAPLEGFVGAKVKRNADGSDYVDLFFAGPIRSAGGTGQALSVLIADIVRRDLGIGRYRATREEVERFKEEIPVYKRVQHLQYTPTSEEIELLVSNLPVSVNGEGTEDEEISGHRDLPRIETNRLRGGACLVIADGLCLKAPKIQDHVRRLGIDGWGFIERFQAQGEKEEASVGIDPSDKFMDAVVAGRPVLCHPSRPGGLRLRYGRTRATGLAAVALNPATMHLLDEFIAVGTQLKTERPGKAAAVTPCDTIEGPIVALRSGDLVQVDRLEDARALAPQVERIVDVGEILVSFGEFLENNHVLVPGAYSPEWYREDLRRKLGEVPVGWESMDFDAALSLSREKGVPLHPRFGLFWHDLPVEDLRYLREFLAASGQLRDGALVLPREPRAKGILEALGALHTARGDALEIRHHAKALLLGLGVDVADEGLRLKPDVEAGSGGEYATHMAGIALMPRGPTRIGARMGRPEKAAPRLMKPAPHILFPLGPEGGLQRLFREAMTKEELSVEVGVRVCQECRGRWFLPKCGICGGHTVPKHQATRVKIPLRKEFQRALAHLGESKAPEVKGVQGMISKPKTPEALEKGILRAKHNVHVFKDGTVRFDMTNLPLTHFTPREIGTSVERLHALGYERAADGSPLAADDQLVELRPQDFIAAEECGDEMLRVSHFLDELLQKVYRLPTFYRAERREDLVGQLFISLAPHTSGGVLCRLLGYTKVRGCFAHPYLVAARRRNCDSDEDCVMLLLDGLINFSRSYLPDKRGGLMDAPLVLSTVVDPNEVDKEAHRIDLVAAYPYAFYEATTRYAHPREVEKLVDRVGTRIGTPGQYEGLAFSHAVAGISEAPLRSAYGDGSMEEKLAAQLRLGAKIRAVDVNDVVRKIVVHHLLPDMIGNLGQFSKQKFRCAKCNNTFRRVPLTGKCPECGGDLTLTVHEASVRKYLELSKRISQQYDVSNYLRQRIGLLEEAMESLFTSDKQKDMKLDDYF
ncbi:MAG TPA: DNA polymerase II large subunit [Thermoplasmata archaeon]|nr:DNA polymerase II large subunit [Thermoplasmata archaeon]